MKKAWKVILIVVLAAVVLGAIFTGVGIMTGADMDRIYAVLDSRYHIDMYWNYAIEVWNSLMTQL